MLIFVCLFVYGLAHEIVLKTVLKSENVLLS